MIRARGFALIIVLWAVVAIGLGAAILTSTGRRTLEEASAVGRRARADAALDSAVARTIFHLLAPGELHWPATGSRLVAADDSTVAVELLDQAGFVNPNTATPALLAALLVALGQTDADAAALATAIVEWRTQPAPNPTAGPAGPQAASASALRYRAANLGYAPPNAAFQSLDELRLVLGMTPALFSRLEPDLTLWHEGNPDPRLAPPPVRAALRSLGAGVPGASVGGDTVTVALLCRIRSGPARAARRVVVRLQPAATPPYLILLSEPM